jgi:DnaK suppressor protein
MAIKKNKRGAKTKAKTSNRSKTKQTTKAKTKAKPKAKVKAKVKAKTKTKAKVKTKAKAGSKSKTKAKAKTKTKTKAKTLKAAKKFSVKRGTAKKAKPSVKAKVKKQPKKKATARKTAAGIKSAAAKPRKTAPRKKQQGNPDQASFVPYRARKNEKYMNNQQKQHFREILDSWKVELMEEVDRTVNHMQEEAANYPDWADRASQEEEFNLELKTRDRERRLIRKIDSTMELIDQDDYGYCESCGIEIGIRRLEARPTATQCIDCKTLAEIKEKQIRG